MSDSHDAASAAHGNGLGLARERAPISSDDAAHQRSLPTTGLAEVTLPDIDSSTGQAAAGPAAPLVLTLTANSTAIIALSPPHTLTALATADGTQLWQTHTLRSPSAGLALDPRNGSLVTVDGADGVRLDPTTGHVLSRYPHAAAPGGGGGTVAAVFSDGTAVFDGGAGDPGVVVSPNGTIASVGIPDIVLLASVAPDSTAVYFVAGVCVNDALGANVTVLSPEGSATLRTRVLTVRTPGVRPSDSCGWQAVLDAQGTVLIISIYAFGSVQEQEGRSSSSSRRSRARGGLLPAVVLAVDATTLSLLWHVYGFDIATIDTGGLVYALSTARNTVACLAGASGAVQWQVPLSLNAYPTVYAGGGVAVVTSGSNLTLLQGQTGAEQWHRADIAALVLCPQHGPFSESNVLTSCG